MGPYLEHLKTTCLPALALEERRLWDAALGGTPGVEALDADQAAGLLGFLEAWTDAPAGGGPDDLAAWWPRPILDVLPLEVLLIMRHQAMVAFADQPPSTVAIAQALAARFGELQAQLGREQARERFAVIAHDLRSPMTALSGALNVLKRTLGSLVPGETPRMVEVALANANRLVRQLDTLLDAEEQAVTPAPPPPRPRVVIVDADPAIRLVMQSVIAHHGCLVVSLPALEAVPETGNEPGTVYFIEAGQLAEACAVLAAHPVAAGAPVVAVGHVLEHQGACATGPIVARLAKPFKSAALLEALHAAIGAPTPGSRDMP
jgi:CheY-like chemotaxis protein